MHHVKGQRSVMLHGQGPGPSRCQPGECFALKALGENKRWDAICLEQEPDPVGQQGTAT